MHTLKNMNAAQERPPARSSKGPGSSSAPAMMTALQSSLSVAALVLLMMSGAALANKTTTTAPRQYEAAGQLCRPKNADGYSIATQVPNAAACRSRCEADADRCGAFEYEFVDNDDRECELHQTGSVSRAATAAMGSCLLGVSGNDTWEDSPKLNGYRCCWVLAGAPNKYLGSGAVASTSYATALAATIVLLWT